MEILEILNKRKFAQLKNDYSRIVEEPQKTKDEKPLLSMIRLLEKFRHHDEFYTIYNLKKQMLTWSFGMETYLEYKSEDYTNRQKTDLYDSLIHPFVIDWSNLFLAGMYKCLLENRLEKVDYLSFRYVVNLPMRKSNGTYMLVKQISMPFEFDSNGLMVSYISSHFIVDKYKGEPLKPRIFYMGERMRENENKLFKECLEYTGLIKKNCLSPKLNKLTKLIVKIPEKDKSNLAKELLKQKTGRKKDDPDHKALSLIRKKLLPLFAYNTASYPEDISNEFEKWVPDFADHWTLSKFAHESRALEILDLLKKHSSRPGPGRSRMRK